MLATCGALGMAFKRMNERDAMGYQRWLRARVLAQGLTIVAIVVAGVQEMGVGVLRGRAGAAVAATAAPPPHESQDFARRLREAEEAHRLETEVAAGKGMSGSPPWANGDANPGKRASVVTANANQGSEGKAPRNSKIPEAPQSSSLSSSSSSWLAWLGLSKR